MSVVGTALERPDSPKVNATLNQRSYERQFVVCTSSYADGPKIVASAPGIPKLYSPYVFGNENDYYALLRGIDCERVQPNSLYWYVTCHYSTPEPRDRSGASGTTRDSPGANDLPLLLIPEVETTVERYEEVVYAVFNPFAIGSEAFTPCKASNGQVYDPPPTRDASRLILTITRNEDIGTNHPAGDIIYTDAVNSDVWWGCPAGVWKCMGISTRRETKQLANGTIFPYLKCQYKFQARPTWDLRILDAGAYYINTTDPLNKKKQYFLTDDGHPRIGLLDGAGKPLADGGNPFFNIFQVYQRRPFGALVLPQSFLQIA